jgi:proteasome alpha subunit
MTMPFYVPPEQVVQDKAEYARKGIARGRSLTALACVDGVLLCAENTSRTLRKISEIYDRIAFGGVGRYNEFDQLRIAGVRHADLKGYTYSREDVDSRSLANQYAQLLGNIFTHEMKPMEVEILVAEVGPDPASDQLYHILYDGTVVDEENLSALGGDAESVLEGLRGSWQQGMDLRQALQAAAAALSGPERTLTAGDLEAAILTRGGTGRAFKRLDDETLGQLLGTPPAAPAHSGDAEPPDTEAPAHSGDADAPADAEPPETEAPVNSGDAEAPAESGGTEPGGAGAGDGDASG